MLYRIMMLIIVIVDISFFNSSILSQIPKALNYQGKLTNADAQPLNGTYNLTFRIWNDETSQNQDDLKWSQTLYNVQIENGVFNVLLGGLGSEIDLPFDEDYWMGIQVGSDVEMTPRQKMVSVGYAFRAEDSNKLAGRDASSFADLNHPHIDLEESQEIDNKINTHSSNASSHHTRYTDSEAVDAVKTSDGAGSEIDADMVDGKHAGDLDQFVSGMIMLWSGSSTTIPEGWALCDGSYGTPDLRNRFIVGAGGSYSVNNIGGSSSHNHEGMTGGHALTISEMPSHNHGFAMHSWDQEGYVMPDRSGASDREATAHTDKIGDDEPHSHPINDDKHLPPIML